MCFCAYGCVCVCVCACVSVKTGGSVMGAPGGTRQGAAAAGGRHARWSGLTSVTEPACAMSTQTVQVDRSAKQKAYSGALADSLGEVRQGRGVRPGDDWAGLVTQRGWHAERCATDKSHAHDCSKGAGFVQRSHKYASTANALCSRERLHHRFCQRGPDVTGVSRGPAAPAPCRSTQTCLDAACIAR